MNRAKSRVTEKTFSVDKMMRNLASSLVRDFRNNLDDPSFCCDFGLELKSGTVSRIRELTPAIDFNYDTAAFKATYQIASIFKRYRFHKDIYSDQELEDLAINAFLETQNRLASVNLDSVSSITNKILDYAASYIANVLGVYNDEIHRSLCRFGKRASVGITARNACEAARWEIPISGSLEQIAWFDSEMSEVDCVQKLWADQKAVKPSTVSTYQVTSSLALTLVPKTFKALRVIMPNTTIGSYQSYGLGEMIRLALKRKGYNIKTLQQRHKLLAQSASRDNNLVTADLSSASDSITVALAKRLLPSDWFEIMNRSRIGTVRLPNEQTVESLTFCTMGIGYTFPLQTLVFLALLKSVEHFTYFVNARRTLSVYGDDMIFPRQMYNNVLGLFKEIGFVINVDKTYYDGPFRESCGGDYHCGVDVRPFQPRGGPAFVGKHSYEAMLYKCINGLLMRWSEHEIGDTLDFLTSQLEAVVGRCKLVPFQFPDDAGIKCPTLTYWDFLKRTKVVSLKNVGHGLYRFSYLRLQSNLREETRHEPYLWLQLRGRRDNSSDSDDFKFLPEYSTNIQRRIDEECSVDKGASPLIVRDVKPIMSFRSEMTGRRLRRVSTFVTISNTGRYTRQSGISGFEP